MILFVGMQWPRGQCADIKLTFMNLAEAFIQSDLQSISGYTIFLSVCVFTGNWTHNHLRC